MRNNYRDKKDDLVHCPFNKAHLVKRSRLITHKKICPDKNNKGFIQCPYNPSHSVTIENFEKHKAKCPDRVLINPDLEKEMEEFLKNGNNQNNQNNQIIRNNIAEKSSEKEKENISNNYGENEGLNPKKMKKKNKQNKNEIKSNIIQEEKLINLESMTNKELFNFIFNDNMVTEYHSDSSENISEENEEEDEDIKDDFKNEN